MKKLTKHSELILEAMQEYSDSENKEIKENLKNAMKTIKCLIKEKEYLTKTLFNHKNEILELSNELNEIKKTCRCKFLKC